MKLVSKIVLGVLALSGWCLLPSASAQITNIVFSEDFSGTTINPAKFAVDAPFFEGGKGDIAPIQHDGVVEFTGTVTEQWWAGGTLRVVPTFDVSTETNLIISIDRVSEYGAGSASRSALWIMDSTQKKYVLFADVRAEGGWRYNRNIGEAGDAPTGSGTDILAFNGDPWDDSGLHVMKAVANGKTVKLYLDDVFGVEVKFPFNKLVYHIGSYARANTDTADTTFDNLKIETVGATAFSGTSLILVSGQTDSSLTVRIPAGVNKTQAVLVKVVSSDPTVAIPDGATGDTLTLTFAAGASNEQTLNVKSVGPSGVAQFTLANTIGMASANVLNVVVSDSVGVHLTDNFSGTILDATQWTNSDLAFETGSGTFTTSLTGGQLEISGNLDIAQHWGGASINTVKSYTATRDLPLSFEMDRISIDRTRAIDGADSTAARTGVFITTADRTQYVFFGQNLGETGWEVNVNPGNPTGSGTALTAFSGLSTNTASHHMQIIANGSEVEVFLDNKSGGKYAFPVNAGIYFHIGAYGRAIDDSVKGVFDNIKIANITAPVAVTPENITTVLGVNTNLITITIPKLLNATKAVAVTVTSQNPQVAAPAGAVNGTLTLDFAAGASNVQSFQVNAVGVGSTTFSVTNDQAVAVANGIAIVVTTAPSTLFSDDFSASTIDTNINWVFDTTPWDAAIPGILTDDSKLLATNGTAAMMLIAADPGDTGNHWPGMALKTAKSYKASLNSPIAFEVDRVKLEFTLVTGTGAKESTGIWVFDSTGTNYVYFDEYLTHDGTAGGWQYNRNIGQLGDVVLPAVGVSIPAFGAAAFNEQGNHRMKVVVNGTDVKLFLDGILGATVPFPFADGITFGIGTYVAASTDKANGYFDNVVISGPGLSLGSLTAVKQSNGDVIISWTGAGTLQSATTLSGTADWSNVTPAPTGTSFTITVASLKQQQFFRLKQ